MLKYNPNSVQTCSDTEGLLDSEQLNRNAAFVYGSGMYVLLCSLFGLIFVYTELSLGMIFYTASCFIGLGWFIAVLSTQSPEKIKDGVNEVIRRMWLITAWQAPEYIVKG